MNAIVALAHAASDERRPIQRYADATASAAATLPKMAVIASSDPMSNAALATTAISIVWRVMITMVAMASAIDRAPPMRVSASDSLRRAWRTSRPE